MAKSRRRPPDDEEEEEERNEPSRTTTTQRVVRSQRGCRTEVNYGELATLDDSSDEDDNNDKAAVDDSSDVEVVPSSDDDDEEEEEDEQVHSKRRRRKAKNDDDDLGAHKERTRKSARSTKATRNMQELSDDDDSHDEFVDRKQASKQTKKAASQSKTDRSSTSSSKRKREETEEANDSFAFKGDNDNHDSTLSHSPAAGAFKRVSKTTANKSLSPRSAGSKSRGSTRKRDEGVDGKPKGLAKMMPVSKSPSRRHSLVRLSFDTTGKQDTSSDEDSEDASVGGNDNVKAKNRNNDDKIYHTEKFKIQRILACRTEPLSFWKALGQTMNTSEINYSSRWIQLEQQQPWANDVVQDDDANKVLSERFLVKWNDLSYLHVSWELEQDLAHFIKGAKPSLTTFARKMNDEGLVYNSDERCDGDYFDPAWTQVDRILEVVFPDNCPCDSVGNEDEITNEQLGIVVDLKDPNYTNGLGRQFLIKWKNLPYNDCSYEFERDLILHGIEYTAQLHAFNRRTKVPNKTQARKLHSQGESEMRRLYKDVFGDKSDTKQGAAEEFQTMLEAIVFQNGGRLRDYQAEGVAWMIANYVNHRPSILADEMGLGKTIQTAAFLHLLAAKFHRRGPFLIIVPLSTLGNWERELGDWLDLNTVVYHGNATDRTVIRELDMAREGCRPNKIRFNELYLRRCRSNMQRDKTPGNPWMVEVVLTTPELLCAEDYTELTAITWEAVVVDEAHRLKNHKSKFAVNLRDRNFQFCHKVLLTGTPIQNDVKEFWTLLNFIMPDSFDDCDAFLEKYGEMKSKETLDELHAELQPYILRRLKEDVEKSVPPKEETVIEVELTVSQKQYYRALYEKNVKFLLKNKRKPLDGPSLNNLAMQLRKVCNHLFLLKGVEVEFHTEQLKKNKDLSDGDLLVMASGKLVLLDKLLPRLKQDGHRILMFSQFKIMLDVLEDYLNERNMKFERIDGSITGKQRQQAIDRYQAPPAEGKESPFIMLLSTRAGGVGINLTAADTCIIFDSDWNPQNDIQAQARCHRIGQTKNVKVYRLLTSKTYEMHMFNVSSLKLGLDQAVLHGFEAGKSRDSSLTKAEVEHLLRQGAYSIFSEEKEGASEDESNAFVHQDIDTILERRTKTVVYENSGSNSKAVGGAFSKARFSDGKDANKHENIDINDPEFWKKMVGEGQEDENMKENLPEKRSRAKCSYAEEDPSFLASDDDADQSGGGEDDNSEDGDFEEGDADSESDDELVHDEVGGAKCSQQKKAPQQAGLVQPQQQQLHAHQVQGVAAVAQPVGLSSHEIAAAVQQGIAQLQTQQQFAAQQEAARLRAQQLAILSGQLQGQLQLSQQQEFALAVAAQQGLVQRQWRQHASPHGQPHQRSAPQDPP